MKKIILPAILLAALSVLPSCSDFSAYRYRQMYAMIQPVENFDRYYEDRALAFQFEITEKKVQVEITNKSESAVEVDWPSAHFIDTSGMPHDVANMQTLFTKDTAKIKASTIEAGKTEENVIVPLDSVERLEQWTWYVKPFYNMEDDSAQLNLKKTFRIILPVKVGDERRRYSFQFMVTNVVPYRGRTPG